jgi:hypothetical protein
MLKIVSLIFVFLFTIQITNGSKYDINCDIDSTHSCLWSEVNLFFIETFYVDFQKISLSLLSLSKNMFIKGYIA